MMRSHVALVFAIGLMVNGCGGKSSTKVDAGDEGGSGGDTGGKSGGDTGGKSGGDTGGSGTGGSMDTGGSGTGGSMDTGGAGGDTGGSGGEGGDGGAGPSDGGAGNSMAECKDYCTCMMTECAAQEPRRCITTCMAAKNWDLSCRTMACMDVKMHPMMKAADCSHAVGMMGMCMNTSGGGTGGSGGGGSGGGEDAGTPEGDAGGNSRADCRAYCGCMAMTCAAQEPRNCQTACMAAKTWDLSCRTMACMAAQKTPAMKAAECQHAIGMMGMCMDM